MSNSLFFFIIEYIFCFIISYTELRFIIYK